MNLSARLETRIGMHRPVDPDDLKRMLEDVNPLPDELSPFLTDPAGKPYGRNLVYQTPHVEVILMNWELGCDCLPHDHAAAYGFVKVMAGRVQHVVYEREPSGALALQYTEELRAGELLFAPIGVIHQMGNPSARDPLITLHFYAPPISGMSVFDLDRSLACRVSNDCGAWWPDPEQAVGAPLRLEFPESGQKARAASVRP